MAVRLGEAALAQWEQAWAGPQADCALQPLFRPALLADQNIRFIVAYQAGQIAAGCIACRTGEAAGVWNLFTPEDDPMSYWAGCAVSKAFPGLPLVDYERGPSLELARRAGFEEIGCLRVWLRNTWRRQLLHSYQALILIRSLSGKSAKSCTIPSSGTRVRRIHR